MPLSTRAGWWIFPVAPSTEACPDLCSLQSGPSSAEGGWSALGSAETRSMCCRLTQTTPIYRPISPTRKQRIRRSKSYPVSMTLHFSAHSSRAHQRRRASRRPSGCQGGQIEGGEKASSPLRLSGAPRFGDGGWRRAGGLRCSGGSRGAAGPLQERAEEAEEEGRIGGHKGRVARQEPCPGQGGQEAEGGESQRVRYATTDGPLAHSSGRDSHAEAKDPALCAKVRRGHL